MHGTFHILSIAAALLLSPRSQSDAFSFSAPSVGAASTLDSTVQRRDFLSSAWAGAALAALIADPSAAIAAGKQDTLLADLRASKEKMISIPDLLQNKQWDSVRTILKTPPVNSLWNLGESQNTLVKLAKETDEFGLLELKDELAISLQMCDQFTYDNAFVYFQPGDGKIHLKEPIELAKRAMGQIDEAIAMVQ